MKSLWLNFDSDYEPVDELVWYSTLDGRYRCEVERTAEFRGNLNIYDHENDDALIHTVSVYLSYGAPFGPDGEDVDNWQKMCETFVDYTYAAP